MDNNQFAQMMRRLDAIHKEIRDLRETVQELNTEVANISAEVHNERRGIIPD